MHVQLQKELDRLGSQRWDLINISTIGSKLMFFFNKTDNESTDQGWFFGPIILPLESLLFLRCWSSKGARY